MSEIRLPITNFQQEVQKHLKIILDFFHYISPLLSVCVIICFLVCWAPYHIERVSFVAISLMHSWHESVQWWYKVGHYIAGNIISKKMLIKNHNTQCKERKVAHCHVFYYLGFRAISVYRALTTIGVLNIRIAFYGWLGCFA